MTDDELVASAQASFEAGLSVPEVTRTLSDIRVHDGAAGRKVLVTYHPSYLARRGYKAGERADAHEDAAVVLKAFTAARELARAEP
jgi:uracil-DNA glycosylase